MRFRLLENENKDGQGGFSGMEDLVRIVRYDWNFVTNFSDFLG